MKTVVEILVALLLSASPDPVTLYGTKVRWISSSQEIVLETRATPAPRWQAVGARLAFRVAEKTHRIDVAFAGPGTQEVRARWPATHAPQNYSVEVITVTPGPAVGLEALLELHASGPVGARSVVMLAKSCEGLGPGHQKELLARLEQQLPGPRVGEVAEWLLALFMAANCGDSEVRDRLLTLDLAQAPSHLNENYLVVRSARHTRPPRLAPLAHALPEVARLDELIPALLQSVERSPDGEDESPAGLAEAQVRPTEPRSARKGCGGCAGSGIGWSLGLILLRWSRKTKR